MYIRPVRRPKCHSTVLHGIIISPAKVDADIRMLGISHSGNTTGMPDCTIRHQATIPHDTDSVIIGMIDGKVRQR
jgi:hypothetical protein